MVKAKARSAREMQAAQKQLEAAKEQADREFAAMSDDAKVDAIIEAMDEGRFANYGGYPSQFVIEHGKVYWASVDHDWAPTLTVQSVAEFIDEYTEYYLER